MLEGNLRSKVFLQGPAGAGKTTVGVQRMLYLLESTVPARRMVDLSWPLVGQA